MLELLKSIAERKDEDIIDLLYFELDERTSEDVDAILFYAKQIQARKDKVETKVVIVPKEY